MDVDREKSHQFQSNILPFTQANPMLSQTPNTSWPATDVTSVHFSFFCHSLQHVAVPTVSFMDK
jgi:hypothetical protein